MQQLGGNKGAKAAKGEYIALLDSDDEWLPNHLIRRVELTSKNKMPKAFMEPLT